MTDNSAWWSLQCPWTKWDKEAVASAKFSATLTTNLANTTSTLTAVNTVWNRTDCNAAAPIR